jgi:CO/xanthine dehydrogenase Mo-binding subunit
MTALDVPAGGVGESPTRRDALPKVDGTARYPGDRIPANALVAFAVFSNQPHARMTAFDVEAARKAPGVHAVFTAADVPVNEYGLTMKDQPVLVGLNDTGRSHIPADVSRWEADKIALIIADTREQAQAAAELLHVEWEPLPVLRDIDEALASDVLLHPENGKDSNVYVGYRIRKGDIDEGWRQADVVVEGTYELPYQEHAYLQPEAGIAYLDDDGRVTVEIAGQWTHEDRHQIAHALDLPEDEVRVIYPPIGGAFGGREDMTLQILLGLAAQRLGATAQRPIAAQWSREESIVGHHKRHRGRVHARLGATRDGRITAVEADGWLDAGGYNYTTNKVLGNMHLSIAGPYEVPHARIDSNGVYTNAAIGGAFRGFGGPQGTFVAECQMNKLAEALGMDPVEVRRRNVLHDHSESITQSSLPAGVTIAEVVDACAERSRFAEPLDPTVTFSPVATLPADPSRLRRGKGFACAYKNVGFSFGFPERCEAELHYHGDDTIERVDLFHAGAEVGQGAHQVFLQMAAAAAGVPLEAVEGHFSDTASSGDSGSASASRLTWMAGNSILGAAEEAAKAWADGQRPAIGKFRFVPPPTEVLDPVDGRGYPTVTYGYVAQAIELTVDLDTGHIVVDRVTSTHDVGKAINPELVRGQIEGCVVQAHGYALTEDLHVRDGRIVNPRLSSYLIPGSGDLPRHIDAHILELADPIGPWGARGMSEMGFLPYAPAVVAALHDATGVWIDQFPLTPSRVLAALRSAAEGSATEGSAAKGDPS